jgi:uncharacterized protein (DUF433 family)
MVVPEMVLLSSPVHVENASKMMGNPRIKGKIPHGEWPQILAKYAGGDTIAQIAREYACTAPAIRYIIRRSGKLEDKSGRKSLPRISSSGASSRRSRAASAEALSRLAMPGDYGTTASQLGPELLTRVTGDVVSFFAALDHAVLERSLESLGILQDAIDTLMRSAARTRIELGRILNRDKLAASRRGGAAQADENSRLSE